MTSIVDEDQKEHLAKRLNNSERKRPQAPKTLDQSTERSKNMKRPVLVLINPHSGRGKSISIYKKILHPFLKSHDIEHQVFITESESRVHNYIHCKSLSELINLRSIIVVSGDGLFHETINALLSRPDWEQAITVPIGLIPAGSGNGLAYTLIRQKHIDQVKSVDEAIRVCCEQAIRGDVTEADLVRVTYGKSTAPTTLWSFLSIGWGLLADIDIDSEWLRFLGEFRFTIYGVMRCVTSVSYRGKLSYQILSSKKNGSDKETGSKNNLFDETSSTELLDDTQHSSDDWIHIEDKFTCLYAVYQSHVSSVTNFAPLSTLTDQLIYLTYIRGKLSICKIFEFLLSIEDGSHSKLPYVETIPVRRFKFQPLEPGQIVVDGEKIQWDPSDGAIEAEVVPKLMRLSWTPQPDSH